MLFNLSNSIIYLGVLLQLLQHSEVLGFKISFDKYYRYDDILKYLDHLRDTYPNLVKVQKYGTSFEQRDLKVVQISSGGDGSKPSIFIDSGMHGDEWIGPSTNLYILDQLLENENNRYLLDEIDWIIAPVINPDGYEYSHTTNRLWRKTRSNFSDSGCFGADINRNFNFHWGEDGGSENPCNRSYKGVSPFSEPESRNLAELIDSHHKRVKLYLSFHSAGNFIITPWCYTEEKPSDYETLSEFAKIGAEAIQGVRGTQYNFGNSIEYGRLSSGCSTDYVKGVLGVGHSYCVELSKGYLSLLPASKIKGVVTEMFEAVRVWHKYVLENLST